MIYLIDPELSAKPPCVLFCTTFCRIKPLYGVPPDTE